MICIKKVTFQDNCSVDPLWCLPSGMIPVSFITYLLILKLQSCPALPKIKFGGWPNREEMSLLPSLPPSQPSRTPAAPTTMTHAHSSNTGNQMHALVYRHAHMHKLTRALECATTSVCPHASTCAHAHMHFTHASACAHAHMHFTHANTHQRTHTHSHT